MAKRIRVTGPQLKRVEHSGAILPRIDAATMREALNAVGPVAELSAGGGPLSVFAVRRELEQRLRSSGGRPALEGVSQRVKVPVNSDEWDQIRRIADSVSESGITTSPGQVASILLHMALNAVKDSATGTLGVRINPHSQRSTSSHV